MTTTTYGEKPTLGFDATAGLASGLGFAWVSRQHALIHVGPTREHRLSWTRRVTFRHWATTLMVQAPSVSLVCWLSYVFIP